MSLSSETLHVSTVSIGGRAVMIGGPSGAGKSDLALRLIDRGGVLVSDDYTLVKRVGGRAMAIAPETIAGRIEVRGIGVVEMPYETDVPVALCVDLSDMVDRMPAEPMMRTVAEIAVPVIRIAPGEPTAAIKAELGLQRWGLKYRELSA